MATGFLATGSSEDSSSLLDSTTGAFLTGTALLGADLAFKTGVYSLSESLLDSTWTFFYYFKFAFCRVFD